LITKLNPPFPLSNAPWGEGGITCDTVPSMAESSIQTERGALQQLIDDPAELAVVHDRLFGRLFRYASFRLNDAAAAEDLASEAFLRLLEAARKKNQRIDTIDGWLMGTLSNLVNDHLRRRYRRPISDLDETMVSHLPNPQALLELSESHTSVALALEKLTDDQQQVLSLRFGAELSLAETAEVMDRKENAVKALQFRALGALRRQLDEKAYE